MFCRPFNEGTAGNMPAVPVCLIDSDTKRLTTGHDLRITTIWIIAVECGVFGQRS